MPLNNNIVSQFIKNTKDDNKSTKQETIMYGSISKKNPDCVVLDGSSTELPVAHFTTKVDLDERVIVMIKNHQAIVTGNITSEASTVKYVDNKLKQITLYSSIDEETINELWSDYNT